MSDYVFSVELWEWEDAKTIFTNVLSNPFNILTVTHDLAFLNKLLQNNNDDDGEGDDDDLIMITESIKVSLKDPVSFSRLRYPVRGRRCNHIQCFDLEIFLRSNASLLKLVCPLCHQKANMDDLRYSLFMENIILDTPE